MSVYTEPGKQPSDTIPCQNNFITFTICVVFFAYLLGNRSTSFVLKLSYYQTRFMSVSYQITMFTRETKWYRLYRIHFRTTSWYGSELV